MGSLADQLNEAKVPKKCKVAQLLATDARDIGLDPEDMTALISSIFDQEIPAATISVVLRSTTERRLDARRIREHRNLTCSCY